MLYRNIICLLLFLFFVGLVKAEMDSIDYQYVYYEFIDEDTVSDITTLTYGKENGIKCSLLSGGPKSFMPYYDNLEPSNIEVRVNNEMVNYKPVYIFNKDKNKINRAYTIGDACKIIMEEPKDIKNLVDRLCYEGTIAQKVMYIKTDFDSNYCNYEIKIKQRSSLPNTNSSFLKKRYTTSWFPLRGSYPFIMHIKLPKEMVILDYNEKDNATLLNQNEVKWVLSGDGNWQFWVDYKKPILKMVEGFIVENTIIKIVVSIFTLIGIISFIQPLLKKLLKWLKGLKFRWL